MPFERKTVLSGATAKPEPVRTLLSEQFEVQVLFTGLQLAVTEPTDFDYEPTQDPKTSEKPSNTGTGDPEQLQVTVSEKMYCSYCDTSFVDRVHQKEHYKTDWHRYNLRQNLKGLEPITESKFEEIVAGEISSISGSDSSENSSEDESEKTKKLSLPQPVVNQHIPVETVDSDDEMSVHVEGIGRRHPRVFLRNGKGQLMSIYRCVIHGKKNQPENKEELLDMVVNLPQQTKWVVLMNAAGHFAAAVFDRGTVVVHKTFHRYTVRAKRGTAQGLKDKQGNAPHSAGASLRRYNEAALTQEVSDLIASWSEHMKTCHRIFLRAPSFNRAMFFGGKNPPLDKKDPRIRLIPFPTRRPTFSELNRVHTVLASVECYGETVTIHDYIKTSPKRPMQPKVIPTDLPKEIVKNTSEDACRVSDEADNEEEDNIQLVTSLEQMTMGDLNPFEATKKPKKKKKKKGNKEEETGGIVQKPENNVTFTTTKRDFNDGEYRIRNQLYTACKTGDEDTLINILCPLLPDDIKSRKSISQDTVSPNECENRASENTLLDDSEEQQSQSQIQKEAGSTASECALTVDLLNAPFGESTRTLLHVAAGQEHASIVMYLLEAGADPSLRDSQNKPPYLTSNHKSVRNQFRHFMAKYPDRYDYTIAQIPPPVSAEREAEKKAKDADRRKAAKKARKDRLKEQKAIDAERVAEEKERTRYLNLSEREKRALAAERRLMIQMDTEGQSKPVLRYYPFNALVSV